ncbi:T9SS type B sorting domain-containing protein [Psychroserpens ponticola]|uniref:T9SS type B sorting domain-containing protein n=1 Tax=Psychroserpens ponticola TaxID=2932268 RepID=A0ABY7RY85_9FLAO|nr:T9SS type B sorting domain-containing protein [Psychroserpens ponticola]WCO01864.1 T9SS type B sorting domain-containing protein [Psychroserpens ponticola]
MKKNKLYLNIIIIFCVYFSSECTFAQLSFCQGNSGDSIFVEDFGTGLSDSSLPAGTTTYTYANGGDPNDGLYTVSSNTNYFDWFNIPDHTLSDSDGRMLVVNSSFSAGEFYRTTINGLCENTSYEFSSWIVNLTPLNGGCGAGVIPVNVRFEIWDNTDTNLLASGNTGNIVSTNSPNWQQYALVFQTIPSQTSVILKMINNGSGGCGNDLAIDDIIFKSCGDFISTTDPSSNTFVSFCSTEIPYATILTATPDNSVFSDHFYQWQESSDEINWIDIVGATNDNLTVSGVTTTTYYRAKVAEFATNLSNNDCITFSTIFEVSITQLPNPPTLECWQMATINNETCSWDISGTQPVQPDIECWQATTFNNITCDWDITGTQPIEPTDLECWESTLFNETDCIWEIVGEQPIDYVEEFVRFCQNEEVILYADTNLINATHLWDSGEITEFITVNAPGIFTVVSTDGCSTTEKTIVVEQLDLPIILNVQSDGNEIVVTTTNVDDFVYSLNGINYQSHNVFYDISGGKYTIYVKHIECDEVVTIEFLHFFIPKYFTPNGDDFNDTFDLIGIDCFLSWKVHVFDRYGKLLYSAENREVSWDGMYLNQALPTSDYWYVITIDGQEFRGHFTLKR